MFLWHDIRIHLLLLFRFPCLLVRLSSPHSRITAKSFGLQTSPLQCLLHTAFKLAFLNPCLYQHIILHFSQFRQPSTACGIKMERLSAIIGPHPTWFATTQLHLLHSLLCPFGPASPASPAEVVAPSLLYPNLTHSSRFGSHCAFFLKPSPTFLQSSFLRHSYRTLSLHHTIQNIFICSLVVSSVFLASLQLDCKQSFSASDHSSSCLSSISSL